MLTRMFIWSIGTSLSYFGQLDRPTKNYRALAGGLFVLLLPLEGLFFALNMQQFTETLYAIFLGLGWFLFWFVIDRAIFASMDRSQAREESSWFMLFIRLAIIGVMSLINSNAILGTLIYSNDLKAFYLKDADAKMAELRAPLDSAAKRYEEKKIVVFYMHNVSKLEQQSINLRDKVAYEISGDTLMGATGSEGDGNVAKGVDGQRAGASAEAKAARAAAEKELAGTDEAKKYAELQKQFAESSLKMKGVKPGYRDMARGLSEIRSQNSFMFWVWEGLFFLVSCIPFIVKGALTKRDSYIALLSAELTRTTQQVADEISARDQIRNNAVRDAHREHITNMNLIATLPAGPTSLVARKAEEERYLKVLSQIDGSKYRLPIGLRLKRFLGF